MREELITEEKYIAVIPQYYQCQRMLYSWSSRELAHPPSSQYHQYERMLC